jgi:hypothetical protein
MLTLLFTAPANAQSALGFSVDTAGGGLYRSHAPEPYEAFGSLYPSLSLRSGGQRSTFSAAYTYGIERTLKSAGTNSDSHAGSFSFNSQLSPRMKLGLSDSYLKTTNPNAFFAIRAVIPEDGGPLVFFPIAVDISTATNSSAIDIDYVVNARSNFSVAVSHNLRKYGLVADTLRGTLSNQQSVVATANYERHTSERNAWTVTYSGDYSIFREFDSAQSHVLSLGFSRSLTPTTKLSITGGAASVIANEDSNAGYTTYTSSARLERETAHGALAIYFERATGRSSGLGSISDTARAGFNYQQTFRTFTAFVDASAFDTKARFGVVDQTTGASAAASLGVPLSRSTHLRIGGQYQHYGRSANFGFTEGRVFVSLSYSKPTLWRF